MFGTTRVLALPCVAVSGWVGAGSSADHLLCPQHAVQESAQLAQGGEEPCYGRPWSSYPQFRPGCAMESDLSSRAPAAAFGKSSWCLRRVSAPGDTALSPACCFCDFLGHKAKVTSTVAVLCDIQVFILPFSVNSLLTAWSKPQETGDLSGRSPNSRSWKFQGNKSLCVVLVPITASLFPPNSSGCCEGWFSA